jgi:hypothetical protein
MVNYDTLDQWIVIKIHNQLSKRHTREHSHQGDIEEPEGVMDAASESSSPAAVPGTST